MILQTQVQNPNRSKASHHQFQKLCSQCILNLQKFKLKTNLIGINLTKKDYHFYYNLFQGKNQGKYQFILQRLRSSLDSVQISLKFAESSNLRSLNNIFRNYRKRVNLLSNQPFAYKYNKFQKQEKAVLEAQICQDQTKKQFIIKVLQSVKQQMNKNDGLLQKVQKFQNDKIRENHQQIIDQIQKTEAHLAKEYDNFERSMLSTINQMHSNFSKLAGYLNILETIGSVKAYQIKSKKQTDIDEMVKQIERKNRGGYEQQTVEQLQRLFKNCSSQSPMKDQYKKRLKEMRQYENQRKKVQNLAGQMHNKRKFKTGVLVSKKNDCKLINWYYNLNQQKQTLRDFYESWRKYNGSNQNIQYTLPVQQIHDQKKTVKQIQQLIKNGPCNSSRINLTNQTYYDRFGVNQNFSLIDSNANMVQKRIQFQSQKQVQLQILDDRRRREFIEKQINAGRQIQRREVLHIGYKHLHQKQQIQKLINSDYNVEFIPDPLQVDCQSSFDFTDSEEQMQITTQTYKKQEEFKQKNIQIAKNIKSLSALNIKSIQNQTNANQKNILKQDQILNQMNQKQQEGEFKSQLEQQIKTYFEELQIKYKKIASSEVRTLRCLYYSDINQINWDQIQQISQTERIFIVFSFVLVRLQKFIGATLQKVKVTIYHFNKDLSSIQCSILKTKIKQIYYKTTLVTYKFEQFQTQSKNEESGVYCLLGMLVVLIYQEQLNEEDQLSDYQAKGRQLMQEYRLYNEQQKENMNIYTIKIYNSKQIAKINYKFYSKEAGFEFKRIEESQTRCNQQPEQVQVFKINSNQNDQSEGQVEEGPYARTFEKRQKELVTQRNEQELHLKNMSVDLKNISNNEQKQEHKKSQLKYIKNQQCKKNQQQSLLMKEFQHIATIQGEGNNNTQTRIKKSNSRQQLLSINTSQNLLFQQASKEEEQQMDNNQQNDQEDDYVNL